MEVENKFDIIINFYDECIFEIVTANYNFFNSARKISISHGHLPICAWQIWHCRFERHFFWHLCDKFTKSNLWLRKTTKWKWWKRLQGQTTDFLLQIFMCFFMISKNRFFWMKFYEKLGKRDIIRKWRPNFITNAISDYAEVVLTQLWIVWHEFHM